MSTAFVESSRYTQSGLRLCHEYILPILLELASAIPPHSRILDVGCGNGSLSNEFAKRGHRVVGIDLADSGICIARQNYSGRFEIEAADAGVLDRLREEPFDLVYSVEVIEHLYDPRSFMKGCFVATKPGGRFICSTPYHGYLKNLALAFAGAWEQKHADPLFDGGHIKFFSRKTLSRLMRETGFTELQFRGSGRLPYLWKSMLIGATRRG
jgi:2-polyprenyl-6-hydroxyphenyl methylase/3-demethylubiquinone-9 3-methyltransferase